METVTQSVITCPACGTPASEMMPLAACIYLRVHRMSHIVAAHARRLLRLLLLRLRQMSSGDSIRRGPPLLSNCKHDG